MSATQVIHRAGARKTAAELRRERLAQIHLSIVVTVFSETFSIRETLDILEGNDRGYIKEILLLVSPRASEEMAVLAADSAGVRRHRVCDRDSFRAFERAPA